MSSTGSPLNSELSTECGLRCFCLALPDRLSPTYLTELCKPINSTLGTRSLRLPEQGLLQVSFARTATRQNHGFSVHGPSVWKSLPMILRFPEPTLKHSFYNSNLSYLAVLWLGMPLSSSI